MSAVADAVRGGRRVAAPIVYTLAARLEQVPPDELRDDPATAAFVLRSAQALFDLALVVNRFGPAADPDVAVDVVARLVEELRGSAEVVGVVAHGATGEGCAKQARRYAEAGAASVLVTVDGDPDVIEPGALAELANICRFYAIPSVLHAPRGTVGAPALDLVLGPAELIPAALFTRPPGPDASSWASRPGLLLTDDEVPAEADVEAVTAWTSLLGGTR